MSIKSIIIAKIKHLLQIHNEINNDVFIPKNTIINGSKIGSNVKIAQNVRIVNSVLRGFVAIGSKNIISNAVFRGEISTQENCKIHESFITGKVIIGRYTSLWGPNLNILSTHDFPISMGNFCSIARNVSIQTFNHNHKKVTTYFMGKNFFKENWEDERVSKGGIVIGNDVWVGAHTVILGGVNIADGAVIAANSVVTKDVLPYAIVAGSPAKVIGYRFESDIIDKLLQLQWWHWSEEVINSNKSFFENELTLEILNDVINK